MTPASTDAGRLLVSGRERDRGQFKVPTLRGAVNTAPGMHDRGLATREQVVDACITASTSARAGRDTDMLPIELSDTERTALIEYLKAL